jgi:hypothetical protein
MERARAMSREGAEMIRRAVAAIPMPSIYRI